MATSEASTAADGAAVDFSETSTRATLTDGAARVGVDVAGAELVRIGEHAVFRLPGSIVARVARTADYAADARKEIAVARWLENAEYPAVRAVGVDQPVEVGGRLVVFWESISDREDYGTAADVARLVRWLHDLVPPADLVLPALDPFAKVDRRIETVTGVSDDDRVFLRDRLSELRRAYDGLEFALPAGAIHGDASVGNVLRTPAGEPVLLDLDGFATGPREWDLALTALYYDRFGWHTKAEYDEFAAIYGFDVMTWPGYPVLRDIREFLMVTWLSQKAGDSPKFAEEVRMRIATIRDDTSRKTWNPY